MSYTISQIETAIVSALKASPTLSAACKTIASYHGELDALVSQAEQLIIQMPSIYVLYSGSVLSEIANRSYDEEASFTAVVIAKDLRGDQNLKNAMYPILEEIKNTLIDKTFNLDIEPMKPDRIEATLITKLLSIYSFDFKSSFSRD